MRKFNRIAALSLGIALSGAAIAPHTTFAHGKDKHKDQNVTVTVNKKGYTPSAIKIPALKKTLHLKKGEKKEVVFTPKKGQTIAFACSMKMFKGKVVAK